MGHGKPPLGIMQEKFWKEERFKALEIAISARIGTDWDIPIEWLIERNRLLKELEGMTVI
ncbi:MAG: hypothetical protein AB7E42_00150 [Anaerotignaceae bacterium]